MLLYYITDRCQFPGSEAEQQQQLLAAIEAAADCGVDYIELREPDLAGRALERLAGASAAIVRRVNQRRAQANIGDAPTRLLVHERLDVALAAGADGVCLPGEGLNAADARAVWQRAAGNAGGLGTCVFTAGVFAVACQSAEEVRMAEAQGADFAIFGPLFAGADAAHSGNIVGLARLREAATGMAAPSNVEAGMPAGRMPVLAAGEPTLQTAAQCAGAGAAGLAATGLFQTGDLEALIARLRRL